ncbi:hypothetical protein V1294_004448 [Bradyrhizobium sp. AZCC 1678]|uniref:hypothetical protein n=1 Tax=Bradyrhizobium sp. AZCC 1678 TaxID=3117030 RepID=UPI002FF2BB7B
MQVRYGSSLARVILAARYHPGYLTSFGLPNSAQCRPACAHRTEAFGTIFVVTNLENGKKIRCPVQDRGPFARGRSRLLARRRAPDRL